MERNTRSVNLMRSIYLIFTLYLIHTTVVVGDPKDEYLLSDESLTSPYSDYLTFRSLSKRDTPSDKKATYSEKKVKPKTTFNFPTTVGPEDKTSIGPDDKVKVTKTDQPAPLNATDEDLPFDVPSKFTNTTNTTEENEEDHLFYSSVLYSDGDAMRYWVNLEDTQPHSMLSYSHRRAATVTLNFDFPFYGHMIRNITIATGGFLYTGDYMHTWLAATQYIAPLMANFDTSIHNDSNIKYKDNGTHFTVQWEDVYLKDQNDGPFTFQVTLRNDGHIVFVYKSVPKAVPQLDDSQHPVKVGLSDAYIINRVILFIRRKTIYEYHRINMKTNEVGNNTAIYFTAQTTCLSFNSCNSCMEANVTGFHCIWCHDADRCSNGLDRNRQQWLDNRCQDLEKADVKCNVTTTTTAAPPVEIPTKSTSPEKKATSSVPTSPPTPSSTPSSTRTVEPTTEEQASIHHIPPSMPPKVVTLPNDPQDATRIKPLKPEPRVSDESREEASPTSVGAGAVVSILLIVIVVTGFAVWIIYAYKFPQSPSGQLLIRYRPSQWRWRHGEARYTAASIHI